MTLLKPRKIFCLTTKQWVKYLAQIQIISSISVLISTGVFILNSSSSAEYTDQQLGCLVYPVTCLLIIYSFQLVMGKVLLDGVEEDDPMKLLAWIISAGFCLSLIIFVLIFYWSTLTSVQLLNAVNVNLNMSPTVLTLLCVLVLMPSFNLFGFILLVHFHRLEVLEERNKGKRFLECLTSYFNLNA